VILVQALLVGLGVPLKFLDHTFLQPFYFLSLSLLSISRNVKPPELEDSDKRPSAAAEQWRTN
jgi:hypothetical protein